MGGWTLEGAEAVLQDPDPAAPTWAILGVLVDKSLVQVDALAGDDWRYRMLQPVREYALARSQKVEMEMGPGTRDTTSPWRTRRLRRGGTMVTRNTICLITFGYLRFSKDAAWWWGYPGICPQNRYLPGFNFLRCSAASKN